MSQPTPSKGNKTLNEILGIREPPPPNATGLVHRAYAAGTVPLRELEDEDLHLLVSQGHGLEHVLPIAVTRLQEDLWREAWAYPGDLLVAVLRVTEAGVRDRQELARGAWARLDEVEGVTRRVVDDVLRRYSSSQSPSTDE